MASPEIVLTLFALGLVLSSRRPFQSHSRGELIASASVSAAYPAHDELAPPRGHRHSRLIDEYRNVGTFTSHFYDLS